MKKAFKLVFILLLVLMLFSCRRSEIKLSQILAQPYIRTNSEMGLSLYFRTTIESADKSSINVKDPSGNLTWNLPLSETEFDGTKYYGTSDIAMPKGSLLPVGEWTVSFIYKDGRTISETFDVSYRDAETVLSKYQTEELPVFDAESNLTIIK